MSPRRHRTDAGAPATLRARLRFGWWMPVAALLAPAGYAAFRAFVGDDGAVEELTRALLWPGVIIYVVTVAVLWAGWALELE